MSLFRSPVAAALLAAALLFPSAVRAEPGHKFAPLTPEEIKAIAAAVPARARAVPARPRTILVFYRTEGFVHGSIPYANEALRQLGARTGAFRAEFGDDMAVFTPERLARYDAVVFQNTTHLDFSDPAQRKALLEFIRSGKGFVGIHAASDNFYSWPEAQAMLGGHFHSHPWISMDTVAVKVDDPGHPVVAAFGGKGFWIREEIYQIVGPYDRTKQRVLLSLDMSRPENIRLPEALVRTDADFPIAWVKTYGKGRVFYTSIGHNSDVYSTPAVLQHYLDGIQFAIGDLPGSAEPSAQPIAAALAPVSPVPTLQNQGYARALPPDYLDRLAAYDFGGDRTPFIATEAYLRAHGPAAYPAIEQSLLTLLARPALLPGAKDYALRLLAVIGSPACIPTVEKFIGDPKFGGTAIYVLFELSGPESDAALLRALNAHGGSVRLSVINAIGRRRLAAAIPELSALVAVAEDRPTISAAVVALGDIGTLDSLRALRTIPGDKLSADYQWAELGAAAAILANAATVHDGCDEAEAAYRELLAGAGPDSVRSAALEGLVRAAGREALPVVIAKLGDGRARVRFAAAKAFSRVADRAAIARLRPGFPALDPSVQVVLLAALDARRTPGALELFLSGLASAHAPVRLEALHGLGGTADAGAIAPLLARLGGDPEEAAAAADSLGRLRAPGVAAALIGAVPAAAPVNRAALLRILAARVDHRVYPIAIAAVNDGDADVRAAAFAAIAATSRRADLPQVLALLPQAKSTAERRFMEHALLEVVRAAPDAGAVVDAINRALASAQGPARNSLLTALALSGTDHANAILTGILQSHSADDRREALRAISASRNTHLGPLVLGVARAPLDERERVLALRDYLDLLQVPDGRSPEEKARSYLLAWPLASRTEEQDAIVAALENMKTDDATQLAAKLKAARAKK